MLQQMKCENLERLLTSLTCRRKATKAELVRSTALSTSTVSDALNSLVKKGLVITAGMMESDGGRRASIYEINPDYGTFIGVDITATSVRFAVTNACSDIISMEEVLIHEGVPVITVLLENLLHFDSPLAIGIGIDGAIDYREQIVIEAPSLKWEMVHLKEIVERQVLSFVQVDHRANGAALYEGMLGAAAGCSDYICVFAECPDKFAIVMDGNVVRGHYCLAGKLSADPAVLLDTLSPQLFLNEGSNFDWPLCKNLELKTGRLAHGMAFAARLGWMKSIYFLL